MVSRLLEASLKFINSLLELLLFNAVSIIALVQIISQLSLLFLKDIYMVL